MATPTVGLGERRCVDFVPSPSHSHEVAEALLLSDQRELVLGRLGRCAREKSSHAGFARNRGRGQRIVAGDHHGSNAHRPEFLEALGEAWLHDVLQVDRAEHFTAISHHEWRAALLGDFLDLAVDLDWKVLADPVSNRIRRALANRATVDVDAAHPRLGAEFDELRVRNCSPHDCAHALDAFLHRERDDALTFGGFVGERGELGRFGNGARRDPRGGIERHGLTVADGDGAGLVEKKNLHVAGGLDGLAAHREHVLLDHAIDARDADGAEQAADRGRDQGKPRRAMNTVIENADSERAGRVCCGCRRRTGAGRCTPAKR